MKARSIVGVMLVTMCVSGWGQSQDRFAITEQQVARTLSENGMRIEGKQVSLVANVVATEPNPVLDILTVEPLGKPLPGEHSGTQSWIRITCHEPGICLPFYAAVNWPAGPTGSAVEMPNATAAARKGALKANTVITMRVGTRAMLVMDDDRSHIQIAVVSLENGITGHKIRVASPDHKQVYIAEVVSGHLLRRSF